LSLSSISLSFKFAKSFFSLVKKANQLFSSLKNFSKFGFSYSEFEKLVNKNELNSFKNVCVKGFMGMASFTLNEETIKNQFTSLKNLYHSYKKKLNFKILSMGMSGDYKIAIECGSNLIRLGSSIFGNR